MSSKDKPGRLRLVTKLYKTFGPYLKPYWLRIALATASVVGSVLMTLLEPWPLKLIFDYILLAKPAPPRIASWTSFFGGGKAELLLALCAGLVLIVSLNSVFSFFNRYLLSAIGQSVANDIRLGVFDHVQAQSVALLGRARTGDLVLRLTSDIKSLRELLVGHVQRFGSYLLSFFSTMAVMLWMDWRLTLLAMAVTPLLYVASHYFSANIKAAVKRKQSRESEVASIVQETVTSIAVVQAFTQEKSEKKRFTQESAGSLHAALESTRWGKAFNQLVRILSACGLALVVWHGARRALGGQLSPGDLIVFTAYVKELYGPIDRLSELVIEFLESLVSAERILELVETDTAIKDLPDAAPAPPFHGEVTFENVVFGYSPARPVLKNLSFTAKPGQVIALVGSSGTGKSTLVNLMLRFFDPWHGQVRIDGSDIRRFQLKSLRKQISVLPQEPVLFRRTIRENIAYGNPDATLEQIVAAAKIAQAHDFIVKLPAGYDTLLKERGENLSGGQRQRMALARAILRDAPILILDEPVTGLDAITEARVFGNLRSFLKGRTTFIIAHRLSTIQTADLILVVDGGRAVDQGTHQELLARSPRYRRLYNTQTGPSRPPAPEVFSFPPRRFE